MPIIGPQIPPELLNRRQRDDDDEYAPEMPPEMAHREEEEEEGSDDDEVGPMPLPSGVFVVSDPVLEFMEKEEKRRKQVEVRRSPYSICRVNLTYDHPRQEAAKPKVPQREEWMLVPPTSSDLIGCA